MPSKFVHNAVVLVWNAQERQTIALPVLIIFYYLKGPALMYARIKHSQTGLENSRLVKMSVQLVPVVALAPNAPTEPI